MPGVFRVSCAHVDPARGPCRRPVLVERRGAVAPSPGAAIVRVTRRGTVARCPAGHELTWAHGWRPPRREAS